MFSTHFPCIDWGSIFSSVYVFRSFNNQMVIDVWIDSWVLCSIPLVYMSVLCQFHAGFVTVALQCVLKSGIVMYPVMLFCSDLFSYLGFFCFNQLHYSIFICPCIRISESFRYDIKFYLHFVEDYLLCIYQRLWLTFFFVVIIVVIVVILTDFGRRVVHIPWNEFGSVNPSYHVIFIIGRIFITL